MVVDRRTADTELGRDLSDGQVARLTSPAPAWSDAPPASASAPVLPAPEGVKTVAGPFGHQACSVIAPGIEEPRRQRHGPRRRADHGPRRRRQRRLPRRRGGARPRRPARRLPRGGNELARRKLNRREHPRPGARACRACGSPSSTRRQLVSPSVRSTVHQSSEHLSFCSMRLAIVNILVICPPHIDGAVCILRLIVRRFTAMQ